MIRSTRILGLSLASLAAMTAQTWALPMTPDECDRAKSEQSGLETAGAAADMAQGPEWARANLPTDRLNRVARWIELQEQILFRCPRPKPVKEPETAAKSGDPAEAKPDQKPASTKKSKPKPAPATTADTGDAAGEAAPKPAKPKPQAQKKPKADDAYRPPAPFSGDELQHAAPGISVPASGGSGLAP